MNAPRVHHAARRRGGGWPLAASAQQAAMPVIGFLAGQSREGRAYLTAALKQGLSETGYFEGQNASIEYRWAENQYDRLPEMAAELVNRKVAVIVAGPVPAALAAKAATADIPIVFAIGGDPVKSGLVASLNRPDGNVTGVSFFTTTLEPKRLELLREVAPNVAVIAMLLNPNSLDYENQVRDVQAAARSIGQQIVVLNASSERDIEIAFATVAQQRVGAILIGSDPFFTDRRSQLVALAAHHGIAAIYQWREFAEAGGLMSYGTSLTDAYRSVGVYAGRILKGTKPADLPVQQSTKVELVINLKTAKALGLTFPLPLLGPRRRGDRMIGRREFITLLGGAAAAWPLAARAQQPAMPVIGFLNTASPDTIRRPPARISPGPEGERLCRGRERGDRVSLGGESISIGCRRWRPIWFAVRSP